MSLQAPATHPTDPTLCLLTRTGLQHGGDIAPEAIADRTTGCSEPDWESWSLAQAVWAAFAAEQPDRPAPALVGLKLSREKMDANRARCPCCEPPPAGGTTAAHDAWDAYHGWLEEALRAAVERHGFCLLLDSKFSSSHPLATSSSRSTKLSR